MNQAPRSWLLPTALVGYVALVALGARAHPLGWLVLAVPVAVAYGLRWVVQRAEAGQLPTSVGGVRAGVVGLGLYLAAASGDPDSASLRAASGIALALLTGACLLCVARLAPPPGILQGHPAASSLDALALSVLIWTATTLAALLRALAPNEFPFDPIALDLAFVFSALGSLLLLCASFLRVKFLRGLELGVGDRARAALSLSLAGTLVGAGSGLVKMASADRLATGTLVVTCSAIILALAAPKPAQVTRVVRGLLALLLLGVPVALGGAYLAGRTAIPATGLVMAVAVAGMLVGLVARQAARPLAPEGSRWMTALVRAMDAALHPEPEMALRSALAALRRSEPTSKSRPEIFRCDPPGLLSVDIAGYLTDNPVDFPDGVLSAAASEPSRTLRLETVLTAQVRKPLVRPLVTWFEAQGGKTATALMDEAGAVGLLVLPKGKRRSPLSMEEAELLGDLAERLSGLLSVTSSLRRARHRELGFQKLAEAADAKAESLSAKLSEQHRADHLEAARKVEILRSAAHSPGAQIVRQQLEEHASAPVIRLKTPPGVDPLPWSAHAHLHRFEVAAPLVIMDFREQVYRTAELDLTSYDSSPFNRAKNGTIVLIHPGALPEKSQTELLLALTNHAPPLVIACISGARKLSPGLARVLTGPEIELPSLAERSEDLQALILNELVRIGLSERGQPLGIERAALHRLIERKYPGNDAELLGLLASLAAQSEGERVTLEAVDTLLFDETAPPEPVAETRRRSQHAPRTRRR